MRIASDMTALVGNTPLVRLNRLSADTGAQVLAKLEFYNPASSVKDRVALSLINAAEKEGTLRPGKTPPDVLIEPTSGNTGIGLAFVAAVRGYRLILTMPEHMSEERKILLKGLGAELVLTPKELGVAGAVAEAERLVRETPGALMLGQFDNPANPAVHYATTAEEIWQDTDGRIDVVVSAAGTSGTVTGIGKRLRELKSDIEIYAVEPAESPVLSGGKAGPHGIQGIGPGFVPGVLDRSLLSGVLPVRTEDALNTAKRLIREEGILCGISSGAAAHAALALAHEPKYTGKTIAFIVCDTAERYLSTDLFR